MIDKAFAELMKEVRNAEHRYFIEYKCLEFTQLGFKFEFTSQGNPLGTIAYDGRRWFKTVEYGETYDHCVAEIAWMYLINYHLNDDYELGSNPTGMLVRKPREEKEETLAFRHVTPPSARWQG